MNITNFVYIKKIKIIQGHIPQQSHVPQPNLYKSDKIILSRRDWPLAVLINQNTGHATQNLST
jgi:hypothetical protein